MNIKNLQIKSSQVIFLSLHNEKEAGQNYQLIIPFIANSKCVSIEDVLFCILERKDSHSRASGFEKVKNRVEAYARTYADVFDNLSGDLDVNLLDQYKQYGLSLMYSWLLKNDVDYKKTISFRHHIKECKDLGVPLSKRYMKMGYWTKLFSIKSYFVFSRCLARLRSIVCSSKKM